MTSPLPRQDLLTVVARKWWLIALAVGLAVAASAVVTARRPLEFRASNLIVVKPSTQITSSADILRAMETLERRSVLATFARLVTTRTVREMAAGKLETELAALKSYELQGKVLPNRNMIEVEASGPERVMVARIANAAAASTQQEAAKIYSAFELDVVEEAQPPGRSAQLDWLRSSTVSGVLGLFMGIGAAVFLHRAQTFPL